MDRTAEEKLSDIQRAVEYLKRKKRRVPRVLEIELSVFMAIVVAIIMTTAAIVFSISLYFSPPRETKNTYYMYNPSVTIEDNPSTEWDERD